MDVRNLVRNSSIVQKHTLRNYLFVLVFSFVCSLVLLSIAAQGAPENLIVQTYVDHTIEISATGASTIIGSSNAVVADIVPANSTLAFDTNALTTKKGDYWTFTYYTAQVINVSLVKITLPVGAVVNYVHSSANTFIESGNSIILTFTDMNQPINITVQYSFKSAASTKQSLQSSFFSTKNKQYALIVLGCALFITLFGIATLIVSWRKRHPSLTRIQTVASGIDVQKLNVLKRTLNETQIKIIDALIERNGRATQNALAHHTQIPKASLSRNVDLLVQKQILIKHSGGYTNQLAFHESLQIAQSKND